MNTRKLNDFEAANLVALNNAKIDSALIFITKTGLEKAILDATEPVRKLLRVAKIHDYSGQPKGPENKVIVEAMLLAEDGIHPVRTTLYRPETKDGDPRLWFSKLGKHASPEDVVAIFVYNQIVYALNLTRSKLAKNLDAAIDQPDIKFIKKIASEAKSSAIELLEMLKKIAADGPIRALCEGPTSIGRSLETALGIRINSSQKPDYKGIEIKAGRSRLSGKRENRVTLFACVPDWEKSSLRSSYQILEKFGYLREKIKKLYCTVTAKGVNSQGLVLELSEAERLLKECFVGKISSDVCVWPLDRLHERLQDKHKETFWIKAESFRSGSLEYFKLVSVTHTSRPSNQQFDRLLSDGTITLDHLIKKTAEGKVTEKGPLFKVERPRLKELFLGEIKNYDLC